MYIDISIYICFLFGHKQTVLLKKGNGRIFSEQCFVLWLFFDLLIESEEPHFLDV